MDSSSPLMGNGWKPYSNLKLVLEDPYHIDKISQNDKEDAILFFKTSINENIFSFQEKLKLCYALNLPELLLKLKIENPDDVHQITDFIFSSANNKNLFNYATVISLLLQKWLLNFLANTIDIHNFMKNTQNSIMQINQEVKNQKDLQQKLTQQIEETGKIQEEYQKSVDEKMEVLSRELKTIKQQFQAHDFKINELSNQYQQLPNIYESFDDTTCTQIPQGSNLNNYTKFGNYCCTINEIAATIQSKPFSNYPFRMIVSTPTGTNDWRYQKIINWKGLIYDRVAHFENNQWSWGNWKVYRGNTIQ